MRNRFRVAVIGCGFAFEFWLETLRDRPDVDLVAIADIDLGRAEARLAQYELTCPTVTSVEEALAVDEPNLVINLTPPQLHRAVVGAALEAGCDVLGEKPLAMTLGEAAELLELTRRTGRTYAVTQQRRFVPEARALRDGVAEGLIGKPTFICADFFRAHSGGPEYLNALESPLLDDMTIHHFDLARFFNAGAEAVAVSCYVFNPEGSWYPGNAAAVCTFELCDGSVFSYRGYWCAPGAETSWNASWRIVGTRGTVLWDGSNLPYTEIPASSTESHKREEWPATFHGTRAHPAWIADALDSLAAGRKLETAAEDNVKSLAMVLAARESARQLRRVEIESIGADEHRAVAASSA